MTQGSSQSHHCVTNWSRVWQLYILIVVLLKLPFVVLIVEIFFSSGLFSGVLLGDRGYACQPFLMTPYPDPGEGPRTSFNVAHAKTRVRIEITFGILKARFTCLRGLRVAPERACRIITACVVLHNIATMRKERAPPANPQPPDVVDPITLDYPTGRAVREAIVLLFAL